MVADLDARFGPGCSNGVAIILTTPDLPKQFGRDEWAGQMFRPAESAFDWAHNRGLISPWKLSNKWTFTELGLAVRQHKLATETPNDGSIPSGGGAVMPVSGRSPSGRATHERSQSSLSPPSVSVPNAEPRTWMKEPCGPCPYSRVNTLWLRPGRAEDFANQASNPYNDFPCHKTALLHEDEDGSGEYIAGARSLTCNGFLSLQVNENGRGPKGFEPHPDAFGDTWEMIDHHTEHDDEECRRRASAIEARRAETHSGSVADESAVGEAETPNPRGDSSHD